MCRASRGLPVLRLLLTVCVLLAGASPATAEKSKLGLSPEDQKKHDELLRSAEKHVARGKLAIQLGAVVMAVGLLYGAYSTVTKGFKITETRRVEGTGARVIAGFLVLMAIAVVFAGFVYAPSLLPRPAGSP